MDSRKGWKGDHCDNNTQSRKGEQKLPLKLAPIALVPYAEVFATRSEFLRGLDVWRETLTMKLAPIVLAP